MKILFVCTGNICRSPMAEGLLRHKLKKAGMESEVDSCGFEPFHIGDHPDPRQKLSAGRTALIYQAILQGFQQKRF